MLALVPYRINALFDHTPVANWSLIGVTSIVSLLAMWGLLPESAVDALVLAPGHLMGLPGHMLLHSDLMHLLGNMLFLWIFGNVVAANMGPVRYVVLYLAMGMAAGLLHLAITGAGTIGASGAINGVVGIVVAAYPRDRVHTFWLFFVRWGTFEIRLWILVLIWLCFDLSGLVGPSDGVAHWAHIGGLLAGVGIGMLALMNGWIHMTRFDPPTLLEMLGGPQVERKG